MSVKRSIRPTRTARRPSCERGLVGVLAVAVLLSTAVGTVFAQKKSADKEELPPPEELGGADLLTRDGVQLKATYYGSNLGKEAVPVILLHSYKGDRKEFAALAPVLQEQGKHAVLVPDLRGHGESTTQLLAGNRTRELDATKFRPDDFARMVTYDMETLKAFLMKKNNAAELNIEKLCVLGGGMGASVASDWARQDWSWPPLVGKKQGQDVKALVLISPEFNFPGLNLARALNHAAVRSRLSVLIIVGEDDRRSLADARRIESMFAKQRPEPEDASQRDLYFAALDTKLQGTKMLGIPELNLERGILAFIDRRLTKQQYPWRERE